MGFGILDPIGMALHRDMRHGALEISFRHPVLRFIGRRELRKIAGSRADDADHVEHRRSEEHTSELQSLMRISYAVFCLKKKKKDYNKRINKSRKQKQH